MLQPAGVAATPSYLEQTAFLASCLRAAPGRVPGASAAPTSPAKVQRGEKGETHAPSCRSVKRNRGKRREEGREHGMVTHMLL